MTPHRAISETIHANLETAILTIGRSLGRCLQTVKKQRFALRSGPAVDGLSPRLLADAGLERPLPVSHFNALSVDSPQALSNDISIRMGH